MANGLTYKRTTTNVSATKQLASTLAGYVRPDDVIVLVGDLGAGKTHFVQVVAEGLGVQSQVTSPTFNIQVTYEGGRLPLHHFDLYRLESEDELYDIGFDETIESGGVSFVEWCDKFAGALPYSYLEIEIRNDGADHRVVYAHAYGDRARQLLFLWANDSKSRLMKTTR